MLMKKKFKEHNTYVIKVGIRRITSRDAFAWIGPGSASNWGTKFSAVKLLLAL